MRPTRVDTQARHVVNHRSQKQTGVTLHRTGTVTAARRPLGKAPRLVALAASVLCLTVLAGILAAHAFAGGSDFYCDTCTLYPDGVPAVSQAHHSSFYEDTAAPEDTGYTNSYWMAVYFYSANQNRTMCYTEAFGKYGVETGSGCTTGPADTDARCHMTHQSGSVLAFCGAFYENQ
jgi:hypothetical protein